MSKLNRICSLIFNVYESYTVGIYVREEKFLRCISYSTLSDSFLKDALIEIEGTLPGLAISQQRPIVISNLEAENLERLGYYSKREEVKSFMAYPLQDIGVVCIDTKKRYRFTERETRYFSDFVPLIIEAIKTERVGEELEEKISELEWRKLIASRLREVLSLKGSLTGLLEEANRICGADLSFVAIERSDGLEIRELAPRINLEKFIGSKDSVAFKVIEKESEFLLPHDSEYLKENPLLHESEPYRFKQFFGFPLIFDDMAFGVLGFASRENQMQERSIGVLRDLASMLSLYYSCLLSKDCFTKIKDFDPITGAYQFHSLLRIGEDLVRQGKRFGLVKLTLKNLEALNRQRGIEFTDGFLERICRLISTYFGKRAFLSRKGAKFFVIALEKDKRLLSNMSRLLENAVLKVVSEVMREGKEDCLSIRYVTYPDDGVDFINLLSKLEG